MKRTTQFTLAIALSLLAACASEPTAPDWTSGNSAHYDRANYLTGHGQAANREEAKDRARADLSKVFKVAIDVSSADTQTSKTDRSGAPQFEQQVSRNISTRAEQIISGIQIAELWQDPANGSFHALAILPRMQTATRLRQQMDELDQATSNYIEQSRKENDLFLKIAAANRALKAQQERELLQKNLQVVDITGRGVEPKWNIAKLKTDQDELLKRVSITSATTPDAPPGTAELAAGALAQTGFVPDSSGHPAFTLQTSLKLSDLGMQDGWYWMRGTLEVTLIENAGNKVRGTHQWSLKGNAQNRDDALRRLLSQADAMLKQELQTAIIEMATAK